MTMTPDASVPPEDLEDALSGPEPDWDTEPVAPAPEHVDAMLYRLQRIRRDAARETKAAGLRIRQINAWLEDRLARYDAQDQWIRGALRRYHEAVLLLRPGAKTIQLPSGTLTSRMGQPQWDVKDEETLPWVLPAEKQQALAEARARYAEDVVKILVGVEHRDAVRVPGPPAAELSRSGLKDLLTRRDEKGKAVAWGVTESGEKPPGVTVTPPERTFDVKLPGDQDEAEEEQA